MTDFLLELRSEEIPARMQEKARADLARLFAAELAKSGLAAAHIETYATPRRLALIAHDLPTETKAVSEETKGPKSSAPPQALEGFLRKTGLTRDQLVERDGILFAVVERPGRATADVLAEAIPAIVRAFPWPKAMRWGEASQSTESPRWVRPLQGIVALLGEDIVPFEIAGVQAGAATVGHRFHHPGIITIGGAHDYAEKLRACHVIVDGAERRRIIAEGATKAAADAGLELIEDEGLLFENAGLTEWPVPLLGRFDEAFLQVPPEVIQLTARVNQKYFVCRGANGELVNAFVCTANIEASDGGKAIIEGNQKVLAARLADARFFWDQDLKVPLDEQAKKLGQIVFHEKLGTVADKVDRVAKLARWLVEEGIVTAKPLPFRGGVGVGPVREPGLGGTSPTPNPSPEGEGLDRAAFAALAERAARLAKADLVTGMVGEFPELQGQMGGHYARAQGEDPRVADAIRDHYQPVGQGDDVPTAPVTVAVSLADKLDTLIGFYGHDEKPTGSKDPYALRRAAIGSIKLLLEGRIRLPLEDCFQIFGQKILYSRTFTDEGYQQRLAEECLTEEQFNDENLDLHWDRQGRWACTAHDSLRLAKDLTDLFIERLKVQQRDAGVPHDFVDAIFSLGDEDDVVRLLDRVYALIAFIRTADGANLLAGYKRAANILKKEGWETAERKPLSYTPEPAEAALTTALDSAAPLAASAIAAEDFEGAMAALASLRAPIDAFFDSVTVNDPAPEKRAARLNLLARMRDAVHSVADFAKIEG